MKVSVTGTSLKENGKKFTNHSARKTTVSKLKKAKIVSSEYIANVTGNRGINFLNLYAMKQTKNSDDDSLLQLAIGQVK